MSAMTNLIDKLRSAPQGSRELSDEFLIAMGWTHKNKSRFDPNEGHWEQQVWVDNKGVEVVNCDLPSPTESIDDARRFVPSELLWSVGYRAPKGFAGHVWKPHESLQNWRAWEGQSSDPAIALCLAILSAHAQTEKT